MQGGPLDHGPQLCVVRKLVASPASAFLQEKGTDNGQPEIIENGIGHNGQHHRVYLGVLIYNDRQHGDHTAHHGCRQDQRQLVQAVWKGACNGNGGGNNCAHVKGCV